MERNNIIPLSEYTNLIELFSQNLYSKQVQYIPYDADQKDYGWGCAWRCIQMVLSVLLSLQNENNKVPDLKTLLINFGGRNILVPLLESSQYFMQNKKLQQVDFGNVDFPHDTQNCWAEPFILFLVLQFYGVESELILINDYTSSVGTYPKEIYKDSINFQQFRNKLTIHFQNKTTPVFIDNGTYSKCIFGIEEMDENFCLFLIGDPHINNNRTTATKHNGVYNICLENGIQQDSSVMKEDYQYYLNSQLLTHDFINQSWIACFPDL